MLGWRSAALSGDSSTKHQALADAYIPIVRGFLLPAGFYYVFIAWSHFQDETGLRLLVLGGTSAITALVYYIVRQHVLVGRVSMQRLEFSALLVNALMYSNVLLAMLLNYTQSKLVYFVLMAVVFSTTAVTLRAAVGSILVSLVSLYIFASMGGPVVIDQYLYIGIASAFASLGMATLLRKAMVQQVAARLLADELAAQAQHLAQTDPLTGLPNRRAVFKQLDKLVAEQQSFWIGVIDLDGFKSINDVYGHVIGDRLLSAVVEQARSVDLGEGLFGRLGGDEFVLVLPGRLPETDLQALGEQIIAAMSGPHQIELLSLTVGASGGFAHFPSMGQSSGQIYEHADFALYRAKTNRRGHAVLFDATENQAMQDTLAIERALREGDLEREMQLHFQPQYSIACQRIVEFEALARWDSATVGRIRPDIFIGVAERCGLIGKVTHILFQKYLDALAQLPENIGVSFNLSAKNIGSRDVINSLLAMVARSGLAHGRIEFEITETAVMTDLKASSQLLEDLHQAGFRIALDDFGSGYSSFEYIDQLPLDKVKVDKSFVRRVPHNVKSREIIASIIDLCARLDLRCVLEGVETDDEMMALMPLGPDLIQGYLFGKPMPLSDALASLAHNVPDLARAGAERSESARARRRRKAVV